MEEKWVEKHFMGDVDTESTVQFNLNACWDWLKKWKINQKLHTKYSQTTLAAL